MVRAGTLRVPRGSGRSCESWHPGGGVDSSVQTLSEIRNLLALRGLTPKKSLGQNFLHDHNLIKKLVDASGVTRGDVVLEVGPGTGALTVELLARGCHVVACELDDELVGLLRETMPAVAEAHGGSFSLVHADCLESKREVSREVKSVLGGRPFTLVANLPYGAATPLMLALLTRHPECAGLYVTVQREVGDRLLGRVGEDTYGTISVVVWACAMGERVAKLPPECFWPRPEIDSSMIGLRRREKPATGDLVGLADFTQRVFAQRRKQLGSVLGREVTQSANWPRGLLPSVRAESLSPDEIVGLFEAIGREESGESSSDPLRP